MRQSQGYDALVSERGTTLERGATLSGGQRQRLAIARMLLKNPPILILILNEATSALDSTAEAPVTRAPRAPMAGRTTFIVAHRLSTSRDADTVLVFGHGGIAARGGFEELAAAGGWFAELAASQLPAITRVQERRWRRSRTSPAKRERCVLARSPCGKPYC